MHCDPFLCCFWCCVWIIVRLEDPNIAHYKISNRVSHLLIFYLLVFDRIHEAMCLNKMSRTSNRNRNSTSSSSPLLSLVTSTSEISHQPVHTYTTYIWQGGRQNRKTGNWRKYSIYMRKVRREKKNNPQTMLLREYSVRTEEKHLSTKSTYTINTRLLQQGKTNSAVASSHPVQQPFVSAPVTDPPVRLAGSKRTEARDGGRGSICVCV